MFYTAVFCLVLEVCITPNGVEEGECVLGMYAWRTNQGHERKAVQGLLVLVVRKNS